MVLHCTSFLILFFIMMNAGWTQIRIFNPAIEGNYLIYDDQQNRISSSRLDNVRITDSIEIYYPFRTLTAPVNNNMCTAILTNNWLGDSIVYNKIDGHYTFHYTPVQVDNETVMLTSSRSFTIPASLSPGDTFSVEDHIKAQLIEIRNVVFMGQYDTLFRLQLTNTAFDPLIDWQIEDLYFSKKFGVYNMPSLQYFPYSWVPVNLVGIPEPETGIRDYSPREAYRMGVGDQYTAEYSYANPPSDFRRRYDRITCLQIVEEDSAHQRRVVRKEELNKNNSVSTFQYSTDTITETIVYNQQYISGMADETIRYDFGEAAYFSLDENGVKRRATYQSHQNNDFCYNEFIDGCDGSFVFRHSFTTYYDCSGILVWDNYYLPVHRIIDGIEYGNGNTFDSLRTLSNYRITVKSGAIYPNPSNGIFNVDHGGYLDRILLVDINGQRRNVISHRTRSGYRIEADLPKGIYTIISIHADGSSSSIGKIAIIPD